MIAKKTFKDRVADMESQQVDLYKKADELIDSADLDKAFPRSKHDPYDYEAVVKEILERDAERQEIEKEEIEKGDIVLPELTNVTRAEAVEDAGLKTFNRVSNLRSAPHCK